MKNCPYCNKELKDTAKFCGGCGKRLQDAVPPPVKSADAVVCPKCGNQLRPGAKFCGKCGTKIETVQVQPDSVQPSSKQLEQVGNSGFVRWTMLPGQIAVKITEAEFEACGKIKGIAIQEGTKALFFVNGKIVAELSAGNYKLNELKEGEKDTSNSEKKGFLGFLQRAGAAAARAAAGLFRAVSGNTEKPAISAVLVRSTDFPLVFNFKDANTASIRSEVGLHILCRVGNVNEFYRNLLLDKKFVCFEELQKSLGLVIKSQVDLAVAAYTPDKIENNPALVQQIVGMLQTAVAGVYPFIEIKRVLQITANNTDIERLRRMGEELYVSEQELAHLQKRNDFLNRLQSVKNEQEIAEIKAANGQEINKGQLEADFRAKKLEIYKQMALTADEQAKFDLMLAAERKLREAKTQEEIDAALHEYAKSGMIRGQEIDQLKHQGRMADLRNTQEYDMSKLQGELAMKRTQDEYADERRDKEAAFQDARRRAELNLDKEEQQNQLEMLRQAQALRQEREDAEHRRQMEAENAARQHEEAMQKQQLDAKIENQRIYAGMSFEQIMAANPDISPEAAKALAQKFSSENKDELLRAREADMARQNAQQMEMMKMMQQMAMAGMGANMQHQQEMIAAKQSELERTRADASRNEDRMLAGVQSTVTAAGVAFTGRNNMAQQGQRRKDVPAEPTKGSAPASASTQQEASSAPKCPKCGAPLEPDSSFCGECGAAL